MRAVLHRLIASLMMFAFLGAMSVQAIPSAEALGLAGSEQATKAGTDCSRMAVGHPERRASQPMPDKGPMPDCVKKMGCIDSLVIPSRSGELATPVSYTPVAYWVPAQPRAGLSVEPDLFPPIGG
ncbi:MAG TPA: hypothetical protein VJ770_04965 [Stellaceae bacterium]|nr:hypothetical protein [Stellaceae bacterium]